MSDHLIGIAGLAAGLPGLLQVCLHLGQFLTTKLNSVRDADSSISDYVLRIVLHWDALEADLQRLREIERAIPSEVKDRLALILEKLRHILDVAVATVSKYLPSNLPASNTALFLKKVRFVLFEENTMSQLDAELSSWSDRFSKRLVHLATTTESKSQIFANTTIGTSSPARVPLLLPEEGSQHKSMRRPDDEFPEDDLVAIALQRMDGPFATKFVSKKHPNMFLEAYESAYSLAPETEIQSLTAKLSSAQSRLMHILPCKGYSLCNAIGDSLLYGQPFILQFTFPADVEGMEPILLRNLLTEVPKHALGDRIRAANELATAVWYVHSGNFVHKAITPENVVLFNDIKASSAEDRFPYRLGQTYLTGFTRFRQEASGSVQFGPPHIEQWIYQHPQRWGVSSMVNQTVYHDIYSLGVVLLELGLWHSFALPQVDDDLLKYFAHDQGNGPLEEVKAYLLKVAKRNLPREMGREYSEVVVACLTCVEGGLATTAASFVLGSTDVGLAYMESVIERLERIKM